MAKSAATYCPDSLVVKVFTAPVEALVIVIVTPATTPPDGSVMVPTTVALWPKEREGSATRATTSSSKYFKLPNLEVCNSLEINLEACKYINPPPLSVFRFSTDHPDQRTVNVNGSYACIALTNACQANFCWSRTNITIFSVTE